MKELKIDIEELARIMEDNFTEDEHFHYLDQETGEFLFVMATVQYMIEENDQDGIDDLPEWQKDQVMDARKINSDEDGRYISIPRIGSHEAYRFMEDFVGIVESGELREKLQIALDGRGCFRRFKHVLCNYPEEQDSWFQYHSARVKKEVINWLSLNSIEPK